MSLERRILMRTATSKDAAMTCDVLRRAGIVADVCTDLSALVAEFGAGAGALVVAEEALGGPGLEVLAAAIGQQPVWSDIPVLVLARQGADSSAIARVMEEFANVTVIERPVRVASFVTTVRSALRARDRQYDMRRLLEGLREADQRKTEFLATLAHELRNPLAPVTTALALLERRRPEAAEATRYHALIRRQVDLMARLVDDLMEVSRITRGKIELHREPTPLQQVIDDAVELSRPLLAGSRHALSVGRCDEALWVQGDGIRLTQVFANLLNNAAKYTPPSGRIEVTVRREGQEAVVEVVDSGIGLAPDMLEPIFQMFVQVAGTSKVAQGGLGIGLTLVKSLVELHGGRVEARSAGLGRGAAFAVRLPRVEPPASADGDRPGARPAWLGSSLDKTVLVVDDNRDAADSLSELLRAMGARVLQAYGGEEALRLAAGRPIDAAVLDIGMPGMDGCELARALRGRAPRGPLKLIALTGWGQEADRRRVSDAGFDHHLLKPVDAEALMRLL